MGPETRVSNLKSVARNCAELRATVLVIAQNCAELQGNYRARNCAQINPLALETLQEIESINSLIDLEFVC